MSHQTALILALCFPPLCVATLAALETLAARVFA